MPRLISLIGLFTMVLLAWAMSSHRNRVSPRIVLGGLLLQLAFALLIVAATVRAEAAKPIDIGSRRELFTDTALIQRIVDPESWSETGGSGRVAALQSSDGEAGLVVLTSFATHRKVDDLGFVRDVCGAPHFKSPGTATEGQAFFLLMEAAHRDLAR